jgi:hypothetical protein
VKLPNGEPVPEASAFLCGGYIVNSNPSFSQGKVPIAPVIGGGKSVSTAESRSFASSVTDEAGKFSLSPVGDPLTIYPDTPAAHRQASAHVTL